MKLETYSIKLQYEQEESGKVAWAVENCPSYFTKKLVVPDVMLDIHEYRTEYFFRDERDAMYFSLRWS